MEIIVAVAAVNDRIIAAVSDGIVVGPGVDGNMRAVIADEIITRAAVDRHIIGVIGDGIIERVSLDGGIGLGIGNVERAFDGREDAELFFSRRVFQENGAAADADENVVIAGLHRRICRNAGNVERIGAVKAVDGIVAVAVGVLDQILRMSAAETDQIVAFAAFNGCSLIQCVNDIVTLAAVHILIGTGNGIIAIAAIYGRPSSVNSNEVVTVAAEHGAVIAVVIN